MGKISLVAAALILISVGAWAMAGSPHADASMADAVAGIALPF